MIQATRRSSVRLMIAVSLIASLGVGCATLWDRVRENERLTAVESARTYSKRGSCVKAIDALNRATARLDIGIFGKEATTLRTTCYERLGEPQLQYAHLRLLEDFYPDGNPALPAADGSSVFRVAEVPDVEFEKMPDALLVSPPHYSEAARRSYMTGRVVISFELTSEDTAKSIRVLEMPHPLLASWAIEAIAKLRRDGRKKDALIAPGGHYVATFAFEYRWADEGQQVEADVDGYFPSYDPKN
jgi:hypothetical protein